MNTRNLLGILTLFLCTFSIIGCSDDEEEGRKITGYTERILTVASKRLPGVFYEGHSLLSEVYVVKENPSDEWSAYYDIAGFDYKPGYEYTIKVGETTYLDHSMGDPAWTERNLLEVIAKEQKESEGLPLHLIPDTYYDNIPLPDYRHLVEAANAELIEKDVKDHALLPLDYRYRMYRGKSGMLKWIGILDDNRMFGPFMIKTVSKKPGEMPESYKKMPPEGRIIGQGEWTFLDDTGNATDYPSFDVFIGYGTQTKSEPPSPNTCYFYKDLTRHYQEKYPDAGVKTVVIAYTFHQMYD